MLSLMISMDRTADWQYSSRPSVEFNALAIADDSDTATAVELSGGAPLPFSRRILRNWLTGVLGGER